jgi:4-amino-4-deoxy-L-arabinose transferase-like glycosyltransferase
VRQPNDLQLAKLPEGGGLHPLLVWLGASILLAAMLVLMLGASQEDSLTYDEPAHIAAGYTYLKFRDARLNYEHPPLVKMLAALPLLPLSPHFPLDSRAWQEENNGQWETARTFLYESGNDPHRIAALARLGPTVLTVFLGLMCFLWMLRRGGSGAALLTLFLFAFSPSLLAHGRLVTTDAAAALGVTLAGVAFIPFLEAPRGKTALLAGLALGMALLCKFSTFLLVPFMAAVTLLWMGLKPKKKWHYLFGFAIMGLVAFLVVLCCYVWTTWSYPPERQFRDSYMALFWVAGGPAGRVGDETIDEYFNLMRQTRTRDLEACGRLNAPHILTRLRRCPVELVIFLADRPLLRAWGQYLYGLVWTINRVSVGAHATFPFYFRGEVSVSGQPLFFPTAYAVKEPLSLHLLTMFALILACLKLRTSPWSPYVVANWLRSHPADTFMLGWIAFYWIVSINANLNLGVRHLLAVYPFTFMLVSREVCRWLRARGRTAFKAASIVCPRGSAVVVLLVWYCISVVLAYPSFLAYFNEAVGGPEQGGRFVVDSNLDWGQDLRRLRRFVDAQGIDRIAVNYFGTSSERYELGEKLIPWRSALGPYNGWLAVSATIFNVARARWEPRLGHEVEDSYMWLEGEEPVAKIGYSIFVFDRRPER